MKLTRQELAAIAQTTADIIESREHAKGRVVVVVTTESGEWVGVGANTDFADVQKILRCALEGDELQFHPEVSR